MVTQREIRALLLIVLFVTVIGDAIGGGCKAKVISSVPMADDLSSFHKETGTSEERIKYIDIAAAMRTRHANEDGTCIAHCPLSYPVECAAECIPQNDDCALAVINKITAVFSVAINAATSGVFGSILSTFNAVKRGVSCAANLFAVSGELVKYARYQQTFSNGTADELLAIAYSSNVFLVEMPVAICTCLGIPVPADAKFADTVISIAENIAKQVITNNDTIMSSADNFLSFLSTSEAGNSTKELDSASITNLTSLIESGSTCGYQLKRPTDQVTSAISDIRSKTPEISKEDLRTNMMSSSLVLNDVPTVTNICLGELLTTKTKEAAYESRDVLRKSFGVIIDQLIETSTTDLGASLTADEYMLKVSNMGLVVLAAIDPTGIAYMTSQFVQPICGPTEFLGEIDDGTLVDALGLTTVDDAFTGSDGKWTKAGDGVVLLNFESSDTEDVKVVVHSGGDSIAEVEVEAGGAATWTSSVVELQDKTIHGLYNFTVSNQQNLWVGEEHGYSSVLVETTLGALVLDLFVDECPLACTNFLKLCKTKYYHGCLFFNVQENFMVQAGDPTATGAGGDSIYGALYGAQARFFEDELPKPRGRSHEDRSGLLGMASSGSTNQNASQFYLTTRTEDMAYLDEQHTIFGEVAEGMDVLDQINALFVDEEYRPYQDVRIKHTYVLEDPFPDPKGLEELIPPTSPTRERPEQEQVEPRLAADEKLDDNEGRTEQEIEKAVREKEAKSRAMVLEMIGDLPDADVKPPEEVLFVCKLNPVTESADLDMAFCRFGPCKSEVIRDVKTGDSLCFAFVEFTDRRHCEEAYFKMNNVLLDDRRIKVDFSQSVSKLWNKAKRRGEKMSKSDGDVYANERKKSGRGSKNGSGRRELGSNLRLRYVCRKSRLENPSPLHLMPPKP
ncbi:hypothetical protein BBJ29_006214 [Phytophthora kernoviae]|uniref:peptidylprolyl isomerase n=1 Tax=Phytophthora kernoviae TaxID=325452 RepID=A0A421FQ48_9STRA|nr:hypothetical protein BBJ29_006214 [Phytophthora kernoviae]